MNIRIPITPELRVRLAHTNCLVVELPPEISTALDGREELLKSLTAADVPTDGEALRVERDLLSAKCDDLTALVANLKNYIVAITHADETGYIDGVGFVEDFSEIEDQVKAIVAAHDAEVAAKAVEDFCKSADGLAIEKCPQESDGCSDDLITGWKAGNVDCRMAGFKYAAQLRAKAGK